MSSYLRPRNKGEEPYLISHYAWQYILEHAGLMWPVVFDGPQWYMVTGIIPRVPNRKDNYPPMLDGSFRVYAGEARHLARVARNLARMNEFLLPERDNKPLLRDHKYIDGRIYEAREPMFETFREDWNNLFLSFADWAERSGGFRV